MYSAIASEGGSEADQGPAPGKIVVNHAAGVKDGSSFEIGNELVIGRSSKCDLRLDDSFASQRHARIFSRGGEAILEDLGSTNGTFLNGTQVVRPEALRPGDQVTIGDCEIDYE